MEKKKVIVEEESILTDCIKNCENIINACSRELQFIKSTKPGQYSKLSRTHEQKVEDAFWREPVPYVQHVKDVYDKVSSLLSLFKEELADDNLSKMLEKSNIRNNFIYNVNAFNNNLFYKNNVYNLTNDFEIDQFDKNVIFDNIKVYAEELYKIKHNLLKEGLNNYTKKHEADKLLPKNEVAKLIIANPKFIFFNSLYPEISPSTLGLGDGVTTITEEHRKCIVDLFTKDDNLFKRVVNKLASIDKQYYKDSRDYNTIKVMSKLKINIIRGLDAGKEERKI